MDRLPDVEPFAHIHRTFDRSYLEVGGEAASEIQVFAAVADEGREGVDGQFNLLSREASAPDVRDMDGSCLEDTHIVNRIVNRIRGLNRPLKRCRRVVCGVRDCGD